MLSRNRQTVPFCIAYETAHFGDDIGIVTGKKNRSAIMPLIKSALQTPYNIQAYNKIVQQFENAKEKTFRRAAKFKFSLFEWNKQSQYEGHAQLIFRLRDQFGNGVEHFDITIKSRTKNPKLPKLEKLVEDHHAHKKDRGTITFYLRTQHFDKYNKKWKNLLDDMPPVNIEITGHEPLSKDIVYVPMNIRLTREQVKIVVESFKTTIIDITLLRIPSEHVF